MLRPVVIPEFLRRACQTTSAGREWLSRLPELVADARGRWELEPVGPPYQGASRGGWRRCAPLAASTPCSRSPGRIPRRGTRVRRRVRDVAAQLDLLPERVAAWGLARDVEGGLRAAADGHAENGARWIRSAALGAPMLD